jgi:hypothetical protein
MELVGWFVGYCWKHSGSQFENIVCMHKSYNNFMFVVC